MSTSTTPTPLPGKKREPRKLEEEKLPQPQLEPQPPVSREAEPDPVVLPHERPEILPPMTPISNHPTVRLLAQIMMNGARFSRTLFPAHDLLMTKMRNAYDTRNDELFISLVGEYLEQAIGHVPNASRKEVIPLYLHDLQLLVAAHEFERVARHLLTVANAPVDRF